MVGVTAKGGQWFGTMDTFLKRYILFLLLTCLVFDDQGSGGGGGSAGPSSIHSFNSEFIFSTLQIHREVRTGLQREVIYAVV